MENFKRIDMYKCVWCGKLFRTTNRHHCKFRPSYENCFSCEYCTGVAKRARDVQDEDDYPDKIMTCSVKEGVPIRVIAEKDWQLHCPKWKLAADYQGKQSYIRRTMVLRWNEKEDIPFSAPEDDDGDDLPF